MRVESLQLCQTIGRDIAENPNTLRKPLVFQKVFHINIYKKITYKNQKFTNPVQLTPAHHFII